MTHIDVYPGFTRDSDIVQEWVTIHGTLEIHVHFTTKVTDKEATVATLEVLTKLQFDSDVQLHLVWEDDF
jgi:hypothetical protein